MRNRQYEQNEQLANFSPVLFISFSYHKYCKSFNSSDNMSLIIFSVIYYF